nr:hypothetical protein [Tanacetum cinerariifolium]
TNDVENFPGYPDGVMGPEMMEDLKKQAERFGTDIRYGIATKVDFSDRPHKITIDETLELTADAVIIATGASAKWLGLPSEARLNGSGVSACAVYMLVRKDAMRASKIMQKRVLDNPKIEVLFDTATDEILGEHAVEAVRVKNLLTHETREIPVHGFFVAI